MYGITNILFVICAGVGALLVVIPLPKALVSGNTGTSMLILWTGAVCLVQFVNAIRWNHNIENWAPFWCDFCSYFLVAADVALVASGLSINRRLYMIVTLDPRRDKKAFNMIVDAVLCLIIPWASVALQYVVQQYRFYIYEDVGCVSGVSTVDLSFPLVWMLPLFAGVVSAGYAYLVIRASLRKNHGLMGEEGVSSAWSRRLMAIGVISTMYGIIPTTISIVSLATAYPVAPWPGWRAMHSAIDVIVYVPAMEWQSSSVWIASVELRRWTIVTLPFIIFVFLGLTADVKKMYLAPFRSAIDTISQTGSSTTVLQQNVDGDLENQKAPRPSRLRLNYFLSLGKPSTKNLHESLGSTDSPESDLDTEGSQLVFPVSRPHADMPAGEAIPI